MFDRIQQLNKNNSLFLFGARGTGKTTLLKRLYSGDDTLWIDLLKDFDEELYGRSPDELSKILGTKKFRRVVIDEVQKAPKILDIVHLEIEKKRDPQFILTGSSARKLKRGSADLLAGRAFTYNLFPLTTSEIGEGFDLKDVLEFGSLPKLWEYSAKEDKNEFLRSYVRTYLREEIQIEQLVRNLNPFRNFLEVAAQSNGKIVNYTKIANDVGVDNKTIYNYFSILEDTLIGFFIPAFNRSIRKQQHEAPKFYLFDPGVTRALAGTLRVELVPQTYAFGDAFEHWVVLECYRDNEYKKLDFKLSYLRSKSGAEIDLVVQRPGDKDLLVEIKSADRVSDTHVSKVRRFMDDWDRPCQGQIWSLDKNAKVIDGVECKYWKDGISSWEG